MQALSNHILTVSLQAMINRIIDMKAASHFKHQHGIDAVAIDSEIEELSLAYNEMLNYQIQQYGWIDSLAGRVSA